MTAVAEFESAGGADRPVRIAELPSSALLVRPLTLPTVSLRDARAAVELQLDRLSPLPKDEVVFDVVLVGPSDDKSLFAVGLTRRQEVARACAASAKPARFATAKSVVEGREIAFRFDDPTVRDRRRAEWLAVAPHAVALSLGLLALMAAASLRLDREVAEATDRAALLKAKAETVQRAAADRQVATGTWKAAVEADAAGTVLCAMDRLAEASPGGFQIVSIETRQSRVGLTLAGLAPGAVQSLKGAPGVKVAVEGEGAESRQIVLVDRQACA